MNFLMFGAPMAGKGTLANMLAEKCECHALITGETSLKERKDIANNENVPSEIRIAAKETFYNPGHSNVKQEELTEEVLNNLKQVIDTSEIKDFDVKEISEIIKEDETGHITSFKMTSDTNKVVTYCKVCVKDNELIFHGAQDDQEYVIQKVTTQNYNGENETKYVLIQYDYHSGHGTGDVRG